MRPPQCSGAKPRKRDIAMHSPKINRIQPQQVTPALEALFAEAAPAALRCFGVLAGIENGTILTDNPASPRWGAVWEAGDGTLYLGGRLDAATVHSVIAQLRREGDVLFGFWEDDPVLALLPPEPDYDGRVLEFLDRPTGDAGLARYLQGILSGYRLVSADEALLAQGQWGEDTVRRHGSARAFLAKGRASFLLHGNQVVSEAYAGPLVRGVRELGAITAEAYQGRGFATLTVAHLIHACEQAGERTYWNCAASNLASAAVARKLGYRTERSYRLLAWFRSPSSAWDSSPG